MPSDGVHRYRLLRGRVTASCLMEMVIAYERDPAPIWFVDASDVSSFSTEALVYARTRFGGLKDVGLRHLVAVITSSLVVMGAATVSMALRVAGTPLDIRVHRTMAEAQADVDDLLAGG